MRNLWNIDLGSVRPAELHSAADHRTGSDNARRQRANCPLGATGRMPMFPIATDSHERPTNIAGRPEVGAASEGPLSRGYRHSGHVEVSFESQVTLAKSLTSFGMTEGRIK